MRGWMSPEDCCDGEGRTDSADVLDGDKEAGGYETTPKEGIAIPIELVLSLGCGDDPEVGAGIR